MSGSSSITSTSRPEPVFIINVDSTIVNIALPALVRQLGASTRDLQWVVDGYTTTDAYPASELADVSGLPATSGLHHPFNYVRNSIKAVVDAYDGTVEFYIIDNVDPIAKVWQAAFPGLFKNSDQVPPGLAAHFRYPEELFRVQTAAY